jgi:hypothetical protein
LIIFGRKFNLTKTCYKYQIIHFIKGMTLIAQ